MTTLYFHDDAAHEVDSAHMGPNGTQLTTEQREDHHRAEAKRARAAGLHRLAALHEDAAEDAARERVHADSPLPHEGD